MSCLIRIRYVKIYEEYAEHIERAYGYKNGRGTVYD